MRIFGIAGWSGSGKTTMIVELLPRLVRHGLRVSTVKHAHRAFDLDRPGKDSFRHRDAGAHEVMISSPARWALMHENRGEDEATLDRLIARMSPVDLVLVEGFKHNPHDKLEVYRGVGDRAPLHESDRCVVAVASDRPLPGAAIPVLALDDHEAIARFIVDHCALGPGRAP